MAQITNSEVAGADNTLEMVMTPRRELPREKSRRALVRWLQKDKKAGGIAASPGAEPRRGCPSGGASDLTPQRFPDLTPAKSCRALIRLKRRELTRQHDNTSNIPELPVAGKESAEEAKLDKTKQSLSE